MTEPLSRWATWREIQAQPDIWDAWWPKLEPILAETRDWISRLDITEIWLSGAGTSAYIGDFLASALRARTPVPVYSVASTDLVAAPHQFLGAAKPLVVNFGRSGNSAESIGVLDILDALASDAPVLNITCNAEGILATRQSLHQRVIVLPQETHDQGFAMTSSYSAMLLTALALFDEGVSQDKVKRLSAAARKVMPEIEAFAKAMEIPGRVVITGSGMLKFTAREAALKIMELAAGQIPALWDSSLGFRHGPKSFVSNGTHIFILVSSDRDIARYDRDLSAELKNQFTDIEVTLIEGGDLPDRLGGLVQAIACQIIATVLSDRLGLHVDDPFKGQGTLSRVVADVKLYPPKPSA